MKRMMVMVVIVAVLVVQMPGEATAAARPMEMALNYTTVLVKLHGKQTLKVSSIAPGGASKAVKYEIANRKIASVTNKGENVNGFCQNESGSEKIVKSNSHTEKGAFF